MSARWLALAASLLLLPGCTQPSPPAPPAVPEALLPAVVLDACATCYEPVVALGDGETYVLDANNAVFAAVAENGTVEVRDLPPLPQERRQHINALSRADGHLDVAPDGRLFYSAVFLDEPDSGIQVASSPDGGRTWDRDVFLALRRDTESAPAAPDRQWMVFAPDGTLYVHYNHPSGLWIASSLDGGVSWSAFRPVTLAADRLTIGNAGAGTVDPEGTLFVPHSTGYQGATVVAPALTQLVRHEIRVESSGDGGETFESRLVHALDPTAGAPKPFPQASADPTGGLHVTWADEGGAWTATSRDAGATWSAPRRWSDGVVPQGPWLETDEERVVLTWSEQNGTTVVPHIAWMTLDDLGDPAAVPEVRAVGEPVPAANTDFFHGDLRGGRAATTWSEENRVWLYIEPETDR